MDRSTFLGSAELPTREVALPEMGDGASITVRCLKQRERLRWGFALNGAQDEKYDGPDPVAYLVAVAAINADGSPMFSVQDAESIAELRGDVVERIASAVLEVSGIGEAAASDAEGKSASPASTDSPTTSPPNLDDSSPS